MTLRKLLIFLLLLVAGEAKSQDVVFHLNAHLFPGQKILKVKQDFYDPYVWVLAQNNRVYRVNNVTLAVDDYTAAFAAYSNLQFIDIAGRSKDTVFIASNAQTFIHYANGTIHALGSADGITGPINSIGIRGGNHLYWPPANNVTIATTPNLLFYDSDSNQLTSPYYPGNFRVYQADYREEMFEDSTIYLYDPVPGDTVKFQGVSCNQGSNTWQLFLWEGGTAFGANIKTADYILSDINDNPIYADLFWGDSKGLSQNYEENSSFRSDCPSGHYLNNINVNKIEDIIGLLPFGINVAHQHLLIGTDSGFYFSSNIMQENMVTLRTFSLFHDPNLGNTRVNDICVNAVTTDVPVCENGVWLAADDGLYFLKPDYSTSFNPQTIQGIKFNNLPDTLSSITICGGDSVLAVVDTLSFSGKSVQWYKNGQQLPLQNTDSLYIKSTGSYYAVLYDPCENMHLQTNQLSVNATSLPVFSFNYPPKIQQCNATPDTLQVSYNPFYHYRWYTDGALNGDTTTSFIVTQSGKYYVEVSACPNSWVPSKEVEVNQITLPNPQIAADKQQYCAEDMATLTVNVQTDPSYTINWYQDGNILIANQNQTRIKVTTSGNYMTQISSNVSPCMQMSTVVPVSFTPAPVFTFNYAGQLQYCANTPVVLTVSALSNYQYQWYRNDTLLTADTAASLNVNLSGKYKAAVSSCPGSWVSTREIQVNFIHISAPQIAADKPAYCQGGVATLSEDISADPSYTINWYQNGNLLSQFTNQNVITTGDDGNYTVSITANMPNSDGSICSATSAVQALVFESPATISIQQTASSGFCQGQTVTLSAQHSIGTVQWSTGETTDQITVSQTGTYTATVTSPGGCQTSATQTVTFLPDQAFAINDTTICTYAKQVVTLTAPAGYAAYSWDNGASTQNTYTVSHPGTVSLTVTDNNGCQATRQINVSEKCPEVYIPNAFTPNGDGINDTWDIAGLDGTATVKVFTRWGAEVYQSAGYSSPWNGQYNGKKLQAGVYYYIVTAKNNTERYSGSLTIIY